MALSTDEVSGASAKTVRDTASLTSVEGAAELIKVLDDHPTGGIIFLFLIITIGVCWVLKKK